MSGISQQKMKRGYHKFFISKKVDCFKWFDNQSMLK